VTELLLHGRRVESVFHLLGEHENDLTYSLAWALSQSPRFLTAFIRTTLGGTLVTEASENLKMGIESASCKVTS
jgi:hypothetical protein